MRMLMQKHITYAIGTLIITKNLNTTRILRKLYIITITLGYMRVPHMLYAA